MSVWKTKEFDLYQDKNGKYWIWSEVEQSNLATKALTEIEAYQEALDNLNFICGLLTERRDSAETKLKIIEEAFTKVFPETDN